MKEKIYEIPINDAFKAQDECPFCWLEREAEQHAVEFILGSRSSYMEDDIRAETDEKGFCRHHFKMMYDYGNRLGNALMLSTHLKKLNAELTKELKSFTPSKTGFMERRKKTEIDPDKPETTVGQWIQGKQKSCYVCEHFEMNYQHYLDTFFYMYRKDPGFIETIKQSKGFCMGHFKDLLEMGEHRLNEKEKQALYPVLFELMEKNMQRVQAEVERFCDKMDYKGKDLEWGNARDSIQRAMQKLGGGYPADPVFKEKL
ncbi:MAG: DUF6062 family protein [Lachnospiraceae bacterium]|nr:DUF6062 family protein [Lachnospiraceae bacterium]